MNVNHSCKNTSEPPIVAFPYDLSRFEAKEKAQEPAAQDIQKKTGSIGEGRICQATKEKAEVPKLAALPVLLEVADRQRVLV